MTIIFIGLVILALIALQDYIYRRFWDKGLSVDLKFSAKEAFEGDRLYLAQEITNRKLLPLPWLFLSIRMSRNLVFADKNTPASDDDEPIVENQNELFSVMGNQRISRRVAFSCENRGIYRFEWISLSASNLLHTKQFSRDFKTGKQLIVFPRIIDASELDILYKRMDAELLSHQLINPDPFEFRGIREYQPTDPAHTVNFKASAVAQQLMVNIHAPVSSKRLHIILNLEPRATFIDREIYEHAIRLAASVAGHYIQDNVSVAFTTNGRDIDIASRGVGGIINLRGGASTSHLYAIYETMARLDLTRNIISDIPEFLNTVADYEAVYLVISVSHKKELLESLEELKGRGGTAFMVIPCLRGENIENEIDADYVSTWEVDVDEP